MSDIVIKGDETLAGMIDQLDEAMAIETVESVPEMKQEVQKLPANTSSVPMYEPKSIADESYNLIKYALENGKADQLAQLIELKNREEARAAKKEFDRHFAEMQAQFKPVPRRKSATNRDGARTYGYAPIEDIQAINGPIISRHGFAYKWREEEIEKGRRYIIMISGHGHTEETCFDVPQIAGTPLMNAVQVVASMSTYGRRYSFILGFGFAMKDEDDDGIIEGSMESQKDFIAENCKAIMEAKTTEEIKAVYFPLYKAAKTDAERKEYEQAKTKRLLEIGGKKV